ncbi:CHAT domain-containing protein [Sesbania bispinosa]|nr:CHAT domain-containing protein [Sesbania bispinosa]
MWLNLMKSDADLLEVVQIAKINRGEIHIYYEYGISEVEFVDLDLLLEGIEFGGDGDGDAEIVRDGDVATINGGDVEDHVAVVNGRDIRDVAVDIRVDVGDVAADNGVDVDADNGGVWRMLFFIMGWMWGMWLLIMEGMWGMWLLIRKLVALLTRKIMLLLIKKKEVAGGKCT